MKITKRQLRRIIRESIDMSLYKTDNQFMQDMAGDGPLGIDFKDPEADRHLDDLVARNKGYKSHVDMMRQQRAVEKEKLDKSREKIRKEVGIDDPGFLPDKYGAFAVAKGEAEEALARGDEKNFIRAFQDMSYRGGMMHATVEDYWKKEPGVQKLITAYEDIQDDSIFNFSRSPTLKALGIFEE